MPNDRSPYLKRTAVPRHGQQAERKTARRLKGRRTPASGAKEGAKGDIRAGDFLIECKATKHESISLQLAWLDKVRKEAEHAGKRPALIVQFVDAVGNPWKGCGWVLIPESVFQEILK